MGLFATSLAFGFGVWEFGLGLLVNFCAFLVVGIVGIPKAKFYSNKGGNVKFVGHPMLDFYRNIPTKEESFKRIGLTSDQKLLLLIPARFPPFLVQKF